MESPSEYHDDSRHETPTNEGDHDDGESIERGETAVRILFSILFVVFLGVVETIVYLMVMLQLGYSLVTRREPPERIAEFANRCVSYYYRVLRYLTHNTYELPFPFSDLPEPLEEAGAGRFADEADRQAS